jgi:hypothetical protein
VECCLGHERQVRSEVAACQEKVDAAGGGGGGVHVAERRSGTAMRKTLCGSAR